jgi:uncharacterized cupredoxin-like copper-binding protein
VLGRRKARLAALLLAVSFAALAGCSSPPPGERAIEVRMRYSKFLPVHLEVRAGTTVAFDLVNVDPIDHEFVIGTEAEQAAHEKGDPHDPHTGPGEAIILGGETKTLSYTFTTPGFLIFACHRPQHYAYGMRGTIRVVA